MLFLDEPSVGLDVQARQALWASGRGLLADGCSIVLTTHYLEEAETLCGRIAMLKQGRLIALDTTEALLAQVGGHDLEDAFVRFMHGQEMEAVA